MEYKDNMQCECTQKKSELIKAITRVEDPRYQFMALLAIKLYGCEHEQHISITFSTLKTIMKEHDFEYSNDFNRGLASSIKTAEEAYRGINEYIRHAIAVSFRNKNGDLAFVPDK